MTAVALAIPVAEKERQKIMADLARWREHLLQAKAGVANCTLTLNEIRLAIDVQLDKLIDLRGR